MENMPLPTLALITLFGLILFSSCTEEFDECFYLNNESVSKKYDLSAFTQIETFVPGNYVLKQGNQHNVNLKGHPRYLDSIKTYINNGKLQITNRFPFCENNTQVEVVITLSKLNQLFIHAKSNIRIEEFDQQDNLYLNLNKKSFLEINRFKGLRKLYVLLRDEAAIVSKQEIRTIDSLKIEIEGDGQFYGFKIPSKNVDISILGKGYSEVNAIEKLLVVIKGNANIISKGMPSLYKRITGRGNVYFKD